MINSLNRAKPKISSTLADAVEQCVFHDKYLLGIHLYVEQNTKYCQIQIEGNGYSAVIIFEDIVYFKFYGKAISAKWEYPELPNIGTIAQILDIWLDFKHGLICYILLDNKRYIVAKSTEIQYRTK